MPPPQEKDPPPFVYPLGVLISSYQNNMTWYSGGDSNLIFFIHHLPVDILGIKLCCRFSILKLIDINQS